MKPSKKDILRASEISPELKELMQDAFPEVFPQPNLSDDFKAKADKLLEKIEKLVYDVEESPEEFNLINERVEWVVATLLYAHAPVSKHKRLEDVQEYYREKHNIV